jgi:hypothetical protein
MVSNKLNNTKMEKKRLPLYSVKEMCNAFDKLLEQKKDLNKPIDNGIS